MSLRFFSIITGYHARPIIVIHDGRNGEVMLVAASAQTRISAHIDSFLFNSD